MSHHDLMADSFEQQFVGWLRSVVGVSPRRHQGTNAQSWTFAYHGSEVEFVIVGQMKNTSTPPAADIDWLLRIEEREPTKFIELVAGYFAPADRVRRRMHGGNIRVQFKSTELVNPFDGATATPSLEVEGDHATGDHVRPFNVEATTPTRDLKRRWRPWRWFAKR